MPDPSPAVAAEFEVSPGRVAAVLGDREVWIRAAVALGLRVDAHPSASGPVTDGDLLRLRRGGRRRGVTAARSVILQARRADPTQVPVWTVLAGPGPVTAVTVQVSALPSTAPDDGSRHRTRVTVRWQLPTGRRVPRIAWSDRTLTAAGRMLLGIVDVTARAPRLVVAAAILRTVGGCRELLIARCGNGEWELPGGKVEPRESEHEALRREIVEELGVRVTPGRRVGRPVDLGDGLELRCLTATIDPGELSASAREHAELRWIVAEEVADLRWRPADREWVPDLRALLTEHAR